MLEDDTMSVANAQCPDVLATLESVPEVHIEALFTMRIAGTATSGSLCSRLFRRFLCQATMYSWGSIKVAVRGFSSV